MGRIISWNRGAQQIFGYTEEEALGRSLLALLPEQDRPNLEPAPDFLGRPEVQRLVGRTHEIDARRKDGSLFPAEVAGDIWTTWDGTFCSAILRDVSARRRMEESLRQSEERLRHLLEATKVIPWTYDLERHRASYFGPQIVELLGYPLEEWYTPDFWIDHIHPVDRDWCLRYSREALHGFDSFELEYRLVAADGRSFWVQTICCLNPRDRSALSGFLIDISPAREAQESLRHYAAVVEYSNDAIVVTGLDGQIQTWNKGSEHLFGYSEGEILGQSTDLLCPPETIQECHEMRDRLLQGEQVEHVETVRRRKDGSLVDVSLTLSAIRDAQGRFSSFCIIARDISERKRAEDELRRSHDQLEEEVAQRTSELREANLQLRGEIGERLQTEAALRASEDRLRTLIASMEEIVFEFDATGRYLNLWAGQRELLHELPHRLNGRDVTEIFGDGLADPIRVSIERVLESGRPETLEHTFDLPLGRRWFLSRMAPLTDPAGRQSVCLFARDITERKEWEETLRLAKEDAERANAAKTEFLSRMSHELRTPLNSILGFAQLIDRTPLHPDDQDGLEQILNAGNHLLGLINEVLDMARIEVGRLTLALEPVESSEVLQEALSLVRPLAAARQLRINSDACEFTLITDRQRLRQVLLNLLSNAIKFNRPGGEVRVTCASGEGSLRISVTDTGRGIPPQKLGQLFKAFERLDAASTSTEGIGLGLAISKRLVELMGGQIGVESVPDEGSTFWITLPTTEASESLPPAQPAATASAGSTRTILYIEDNLSNLKLVERILGRQAGIQLLAATSGLPGLELAFEHRPALILLDLRLPDIQGEDVLARLRADLRTAEIPVIVTSADPRAVTMQRLRDLPLSGFLSKPIDVREFTTLIESVLGA
jgi:PAS domain S-box-containing protein